MYVDDKLGERGSEIVWLEGKKSFSYLNIVICIVLLARRISLGAYYRSPELLTSKTQRKKGEKGFVTFVKEGKIHEKFLTSKIKYLLGEVRGGAIIVATHFRIFANQIVIMSFCNASLVGRAAPYWIGKYVLPLRTPVSLHRWRINSTRSTAVMRIIYTSALKLIEQQI